MDLEADELAFTACYFASLEIAFAPLHQVHTHFCPRLLIGEFLSFANYEPGTGGRFITCLDGAAFVGLDRSRVSVRSLLAVQPNQSAPIKDM